MNLPPSTALIAEDEPLLRQHLIHELATAWPQLTIVAEAQNGLEALALHTQHQPQIVFLDIRMPGLSGLEVAAQLPEHTLIVFVTAFDDYAVAAFEHEAIDYLLKPLDRTRLLQTVARLAKHIQTAPDEAATQQLNLHTALQNALRTLQTNAEPNYLVWLRASHGNAVQQIHVDDIWYFQALDKYTQIVTEKGTALIRRSLADLKLELNPAHFWATHRAYIVAAKRLVSIERDFSGRHWASLHNHPNKLPVSRTFAAQWKAM